MVSPGDATPPPAEPLLTMHGVSKQFGGTQALADAGIEVGAGEIVALLGENGAGKSTLIKILAGVHPLDAGSIGYRGRDVTHGSALRRLPIAFIHQDLGLIDWMTVAENISLMLGFPRRFGLIDWNAARARAQRALDTLGADINPDLRVHHLSRTEKSLIAIARALAAEAEILVLDEPTASLPADEVARLFAALRRLRARGVGMIYVSHRLDEIYEISQRVVIMRNGRVVAERPTAGLPHDELVDLIVGHETEATVFEPPRSEIRLRVHDVRLASSPPVSFEVHAGEVLALCGLRGAGQDALGRAIVGAIPVESGSMTLDGAPYAPRSPFAAVQRGLGFATSNRETEAVAAGLTARENLFINPRLWGRRAWQFRTVRAESRRAAPLLQRFDVRPADPEIALDTFSGGNQQKVILARWFGVDRAAVVLEEPTMGVDVGAKAEIYGLLRDAVKDGMAAIVVSTDMEEVAKIAHRALVLDRGAIVAELSGADLTIAHLVAAASELHESKALTPSNRRTKS